jgi:hypothetical protein
VHRIGPGPVLQYRPSRFWIADVFQLRSARQRTEPLLFRPLPASLHCRCRVSLLPRELHAPPMPPPVREASSWRPGCDLTRATAARPPATSWPTLLTSCHHRSTRCTCSHHPCTLPPHHRPGGKIVYSSSHTYRRVLTPPLKLAIAAVPRPPSTATSGPPPATPAPPRAPPESQGPQRQPQTLLRSATDDSSPPEHAVVESYPR